MLRVCVTNISNFDPVLKFDFDLTIKPFNVIINYYTLRGFLLMTIRNKPTIEEMTKCYDKHKNLKLAAKELGMVWQTLYWNLNKEGHAVTGDKSRYGSLTDKMARYGEELFKSLVPHAIDSNDTTFQAKVDFNVNGIPVDVKCSTKKDGYKSNPNKNTSYRWAFSTKVQEDYAEYLVLFCMEGFDASDYGDVEKILLIPKEFFKNKQSLSVSCIKSKWFDFEVSKEELQEFFELIGN